MTRLLLPLLLLAASCGSDPCEGGTPSNIGHYCYLDTPQNFSAAGFEQVFELYHEIAPRYLGVTAEKLYRYYDEVDLAVSFDLNIETKGYAYWYKPFGGAPTVTVVLAEWNINYVDTLVHELMHVAQFERGILEDDPIKAHAKPDNWFSHIGKDNLVDDDNVGVRYEFVISQQILQALRGE